MKRARIGPKAPRCAMKGYRWDKTWKRANSLQLVKKDDVKCRVELVDQNHPRHRWEAVYFPKGGYPKIGYYRTLPEAQHNCECDTVRNIFKEY